VIDPTAGLIRVLQTLDLLKIPYMMGVSGAGSVHGVWPTAGNIDFVARIRPEDIELLVDKLQRDFYIDAGPDPGGHRPGPSV
jgi:hypothetical protein